MVGLPPEEGVKDTNDWCFSENLTPPPLEGVRTTFLVFGEGALVVVFYF